jgi:hypothetical protein
MDVAEECVRIHCSDDGDALWQRMEVLELTVRANLPSLHAHLTHEGVLCGMFVPAWFVTMFAKQLQLGMCVRIWDFYLLEGEEFMYRYVTLCHCASRCKHSLVFVCCAALDLWTVLKSFGLVCCVQSRSCEQPLKRFECIAVCMFFELISL